MGFKDRPFGAISLAERLFLRTGASYKGVLAASLSDPSSIQTQIAAAVTAGATIHKRWAILVPEGDYALPARLAAAHGVDLVGWSGNRWDVRIAAPADDDALTIGGRDTCVMHMNFTGPTPTVKYAIHADAASAGAATNDWRVSGDDMVLVNVGAYGLVKAGMGVGLNNSNTSGVNATVQRLFVYGGHFEGGGNTNPGIYVHDANFGTLGYTVVILGATCRGTVALAPGLTFQEAAGTKPNRIWAAGYFRAGDIGAGSTSKDVENVLLSDGTTAAAATVLYADPASWRTQQGALPVDIAQAPAVPVPRYLPPIARVYQRWPGLVA